MKVTLTREHLDALDDSIQDIELSLDRYTDAEDELNEQKARLIELWYFVQSQITASEAN